MLKFAKQTIMVEQLKCLTSSQPQPATKFSQYSTRHWTKHTHTHHHKQQTGSCCYKQCVFYLSCADVGRSVIVCIVATTGNTFALQTIMIFKLFLWNKLHEQEAKQKQQQKETKAKNSLKKFSVNWNLCLMLLLLLYNNTTQQLRPA